MKEKMQKSAKWHSGIIKCRPEDAAIFSCWVLYNLSLNEEHITSIAALKPLSCVSSRSWVAASSGIFATSVRWRWWGSGAIDGARVERLGRRRRETQTLQRITPFFTAIILIFELPDESDCAFIIHASPFCAFC